MAGWRELRVAEYRNQLNSASFGNMHESAWNEVTRRINEELRWLENKLERNVKYTPNYYWNGRWVCKRIAPAGERP